MLDASPKRWPAVTDWARTLASIALRPEPAAEQRPVDGRLLQTWTLPDGSPWATSHRTDEGYLVRFPGVADFIIGSDGDRVSCRPLAGASPATVEHLYLNQVVPMALGRAGMPVFHASAVCVDDFALAFVGVSGCGKSTLAAAFAACGRPFLADDGLVVAESEGRLLAMPSHPTLRLWPDSHAALLPDPPPETGVKSRLRADERLNYHDKALPLSHVFFLGEAAGAVRVEPMAPTVAMIELVRHSFLVDVEAREGLALHFERLGRTVAETSCARLHYPRSFDRLAEVREAILAHVRHV